MVHARESGVRVTNALAWVCRLLVEHASGDHYRVVQRVPDAVHHRHPMEVTVSAFCEAYLMQVASLRPDAQHA